MSYRHSLAFEEQLVGCGLFARSRGAFRGSRTVEEDFFDAIGVWGEQKPSGWIDAHTTTPVVSENLSPQLPMGRKVAVAHQFAAATSSE